MEVTLMLNTNVESKPPWEPEHLLRAKAKNLQSNEVNFKRKLMCAYGHALQSNGGGSPIDFSICPCTIYIQTTGHEIW